MGEDVVDPFNLQFQRCVRSQPKENHTGMGMLEPEDPLTEIPVASDENALLLVGKREHFWIRDTQRIGSANLDHIAETSYLGRGSAHLCNGMLGILQAGFHIINRQVRIGRKQVI